METCCEQKEMEKNEKQKTFAKSCKNAKCTTWWRVHKPKMNAKQHCGRSVRTVRRSKFFPYDNENAERTNERTMNGQPNAASYSIAMTDQIESPQLINNDHNSHNNNNQIPHFERDEKRMRKTIYHMPSLRPNGGGGDGGNSENFILHTRRAINCKIWKIQYLKHADE